MGMPNLTLCKKQEKDPFYIRVKDQPHSEGKSKIPPSTKERMKISGGELSPHTNAFPSGVPRVNSAGCCEAVSVRGQACLFITAAGLCVLREL